MKTRLGFVALVSLVSSMIFGVVNADVQQRMDQDLEAGRPLVIHVVVALCDNVNQGIIPVPKSLGNGQDPAKNLYWGAMYGVRSFMLRSGHWKQISKPTAPNPRILERLVLFSEMRRKGESCPVYIVADAWDGAAIQDAIEAYMNMASGRSIEKIHVSKNSRDLDIQVGGAAHLIAYVGHNGLMEFNLRSKIKAADHSLPKSVVALACASQSYFLGPLKQSGAHPLLLTTGFMAPEAYTLDALIQAWVREGNTHSVIQAAASAYNKYQKCGLKAARNLFWEE